MAAHSPAQAYANTGGSHMVPAAVDPKPVALAFSSFAGMAAFVALVFRRMRHSHGLMMPNPAFERSARQRCCRVPSSLRSSAPAQRKR